MRVISEAECNAVSGGLAYIYFGQGGGGGGTPLNNAFASAAGWASRGAGAAFITGAVTGAGYGSVAGPIGIIGGIVIGAAVMYGTRRFLDGRE